MRTHRWIVIDKTNMTKINHSKNKEDILSLFFKKSGETRNLGDFIIIRDEEHVVSFKDFDYSLPYLQAIGKIRAHLDIF
jgi:hypothetical protein